MKVASWREVLSPHVTAEIEKEIERAYERGWEDAIEAVLGAARSQRKPENLSDTSGGGGGVSARSSERQRAPRGYWAERVEEVLREAPFEGLSTADILERVERGSDYPLARSSLNVALATLERAGKIRRSGGNWLLVRDDAASQVSQGASLRPVPEPDKPLA